jgi:hypothetical protein
MICYTWWLPFSKGNHTPVWSDEKSFDMNRMKIHFKGVNLHIHDNILGHVLSRATLMRDLELMKQHNINAIRKLSSNSRMVDRSTDVGLPCKGNAPDLGGLREATGLSRRRVEARRFLQPGELLLNSRRCA